MISHELQNYLKTRLGFAPVVVTDNTAQSTAVIDLQGYRSARFVFSSGTLADVDATFAVAILAGDVPDSYTAPTTITDEAAADGACIVGTSGLGGPPTATAALAAAGFLFSDDGVVHTVTYAPRKGNGKRFIRATFTPSGNTGNAPVGCTVDLLPDVMPPQ